MPNSASRTQSPSGVSAQTSGFGAWSLRFHWMLDVGAWNFLARGFSLFLGGFSLLNLLGHFRSAHLDANLWWIDLHWFPEGLANPSLLLGSVFLFGFGIRPPKSLWRRFVTIACVAALGSVALLNAAQFYLLLSRGAVHSGIPLPLSLFTAAALVLILVATLRSLPSGRMIPALAVCASCIALFPVFQMFCFGKTDYRRPADIAVVLGARTYADGRPSQALADRVRTACRLYQNGLVAKLIFSGGPGDGEVHETDAMKHMALGLGVKEEDMLLDKN